MSDPEPDPSYMIYLQLRATNEFAHLYPEEADEYDPDYVVEGSDEEEEDEEEEEEEEEEESDDASVEVIQSEVPVATVVEDNGATTSSQGVNMANVQGSGDDTADLGLGKSSQEKGKEAERDEKEEISVGEEWNRNEIDGLCCPICMEAWTSGGDHQVWSVQLYSLLLQFLFSHS